MRQRKIFLIPRKINRARSHQKRQGTGGIRASECSVFQVGTLPNSAPGGDIRDTMIILCTTGQLEIHITAGALCGYLGGIQIINAEISGGREQLAGVCTQ